MGRSGFIYGGRGSDSEWGGAISGFLGCEAAGDFWGVYVGGVAVWLQWRWDACFGCVVDGSAGADIAADFGALFCPIVDCDFDALDGGRAISKRHSAQ